MHITVNMKIHKNNNGNIQAVSSTDINPLLGYGIEQFSEASAQNIQQILQVLSIDISNYLSLYNQSFLDFQRANNLIRKIRSLPISTSQSKEDNVSGAINAKNYQNKKQATLDFIQVLNQGKQLLSKVRSLLTGNTITTNITIKTSEGVYVVDQKMINDYITPVLSTFGGSTRNNPFSLAYQIDIQLLQEQGILNETNKISETNIYQEIWKQKLPYLTTVKNWEMSRAKGRLVFNSKDAEIYDLMSQMEAASPGSTSGWLTLARYAQLRASMGGGGGYRTSQLRSGDVGLIQDKMVTDKQDTVNIIRQQMIKENLEKLLLITQLPASNPMAIKEALKRMFTENESNISDEITRRTNKEAQKTIDSLFEI